MASVERHERAEYFGVRFRSGQTPMPVS
jgi:hypothetical protein